MSSARAVVYATDRDFRMGCDVLLRRAGLLVRVASRQAELAKAMREGDVAVLVVDADPRDVAVAQALSQQVPLMQRAPGESIEQIVARALITTGRAGDQPRSSE